MSASSKNPDPAVAGILSIALLGPDKEQRQAISNALAACKAGDTNGPRRQGFPSELSIREFTSFPTDLDELPHMLGQHYDVVFVDLDSDPEYALDVVERIRADGSGTVVVYSAQADKELVIRSFRVGAREFLTLPVTPADMAEALVRVSDRHPAVGQAKRKSRRLFVFFGVKGGCGVTTLASNFAVFLAQDSGLSTLLIDLGLPLGDAAINLGMVLKYSTFNALQDSKRLDANFLSSLLARHSSGLNVLGAPGEFSQTEAPKDAINKLLSVARQSFDYVVVDAGSRLDLMDSALFDESATIYLITQVGVSELRNANRLVSQYFSTHGKRLQIVLNRHIPNNLGVTEEYIEKALTRPVEWRIPDDYANARRTQNTATALALIDSPISKAIRQMARTACGLPANPVKKKSFSLFG